MKIKNKLSGIREKMSVDGVNAYFVPSSDAHQNEYTPLSWRRREWLSGFSGSAGDVVLTEDAAFLWTDSRYFLQAEQELDGNEFSLFRLGQEGVVGIEQWLASQSEGFVFGVDPQLVTIEQRQRFQRALQPIQGQVRLIEGNYIDQLWENQPELSRAPAFLLDDAYTGQAASQKLERVRQHLKERGATAHVITSLDAVAWLFNLRGCDIEYNPLLISYAYVTLETAHLYTDMSKLTTEMIDGLRQQGVMCFPYEQIAIDLVSEKEVVLLDPKTCSVWIESKLEQAKTCLAASPIDGLKARKNAVEIEGMKKAHWRDGFALCQLMYWLETHWQEGVSECSVTEQLHAFRAENELFHGESFATIAGFAEHGAIVHYFPTKQSDRLIDDQSLFLLDSGGQYKDGTTDVTRTMHLGMPTSEQKRHYTLVLKAALRLGGARFPQGSYGAQLDAIARSTLWQEGHDYGHGTGHGVGCFLCVHEGPQSLSPRNNEPLFPGMIVSNEPGVYFDGMYGIRIENLCVIMKENQSMHDGRNWLYLEDLTLAPYAQNLIETSMLTEEEKERINAYHQRVWQAYAAVAEGGLREWLHMQTQPLR